MEAPAAFAKAIWQALQNIRQSSISVARERNNSSKNDHNLTSSSPSIARASTATHFTAQNPT